MDRYSPEPYLEFVRSFYAGLNPAHGIAHIQRILRKLDKFAAGISPPPRKDLLYFLSCFHGLTGLVKDNERFCGHAKSFLRDLGWDDAEIEEACEALYRHLENPRTIEEAIVHDCDLIESIGALGIVKAFNIGALHGESYEETADFIENKYIRNIDFRTPTGRRLGAEKMAFTREFLRRMRADL